MRIIVCFNFTEDRSNPGYTDVGLAFVRGFQRLGHDVHLIEDVELHRLHDANYDPVPFEKWDGLVSFEAFARKWGLWPQSAVVLDGGAASFGMELTDLVALSASSDLIVNFGGRLRTPAVLEAAGCRAFVDINPAKTQVYYTEYAIDRGFGDHDVFFTVGLNIGLPECEIPTGGLEWHPLLQPVVLDDWPRSTAPADRFTTISTWTGRETFDYQGRFSGEKADQWLRVLDLPSRTPELLEIALKSDRVDPDDLARFEESGWIVSDPARLTSVERYREFIAGSRGEFSVANYRYVQFNTGWFSDRSARYLASGRPVVVQSTGIDRHLPTGEGLLTFETVEDAAEALGRVGADYERHALAARAIAEDLFDSDKVLAGMLETMGLGARRRRAVTSDV